MTLEEIEGKIDGLHSQYNTYKGDWLQVYKEMDEDTKAKFNPQRPQVPPIDKGDVPQIIVPIIESMGKGQEYGYIERMKQCANLLVEAKQQVILFIDKQHTEQIEEIYTEWPFKYQVCYRQDEYPLNVDWGMNVEEPTANEYDDFPPYGLYGLFWMWCNEEIDPLFMAPKQVEWQASLTEWWDKLCQYHVRWNDYHVNMSFREVSKYTIEAVKDTCKEICKAAGQPNHTKNIILKKVRQYDSAPLGIIAQILLLDGLRYWTGEVAANKEISGYKEIVSLHRWINERLKDVLRQWTDVPRYPTTIMDMECLGNYMASTPIGQEVIKEMTGQEPMSTEARRTRYINWAMIKGWVTITTEQDGKEGQVYKWIYDKQTRTGEGNKAALTAFLSKIYDNKPRWKYEEKQWGVANLKQSYQQYLNNNKHFEDIEEIFE